MVKRAMIIVAAGVCLAGLAGISSLMAARDECRRECQDVFQQEKRDCREQERLDREEQSRRLDECLDAAAGQEQDEEQCELQYEESLRRADRSKQACYKDAKARRDACRRACNASPSGP